MRNAGASVEQMSHEFIATTRDSRFTVLRRFGDWNLTRSAPELAGPTAGVTTLKLTRDGFNLHFNPTYFPGSMRSLLVVKCRPEEPDCATILSARIGYELIPIWSSNFIVIGVLG